MSHHPYLLKLTFDGSIRDQCDSKNTRFVIESIIGVFITARGIRIFGTTVSMTWCSMEKFEICYLHVTASQILLEGGSMIIVK